MRSRTLTDADVYRRLLGFVRPYWRQFALAIGAMAALAATEWMLPALLKPLIDRGYLQMRVGTPRIELTPDRRFMPDPHLRVPRFGWPVPYHHADFEKFFTAPRPRSALPI